MPLTLICHKCRQPIEVGDDELKQALELGRPIEAAHEVCPVETVTEELRTFRVVVQVIEEHENGDGKEPSEELLASFGGKQTSKSFTNALPGLIKELNKAWEQVSSMSKVIDGG